jgi:hypothetical protein
MDRQLEKILSANDQLEGPDGAGPEPTPRTC